MAKQSKKKYSRVKRRLFVFGTASIVVIVYMTGIIMNYWFKIIDKSRERSELQTELTYLKQEEGLLKVEIEKLKDPEYIIRYAKENYLFSGNDEYIFTLLKKK